MELYAATTTFTASPYTVSILVGIVLPLLTGALAHITATSAFRAGLNAVLSVLTGIISTLVLNPVVDIYSVVYAVALAFISSVASFKGFWQPTGAAQKVQQSTANFGIGSNQPNGE